MEIHRQTADTAVFRRENTPKLTKIYKFIQTIDDITIYLHVI